MALGSRSTVQSQLRTCMDTLALLEEEIPQFYCCGDVLGQSGVGVSANHLGLHSREETLKKILQESSIIPSTLHGQREFYSVVSC